MDCSGSRSHASTSGGSAEIAELLGPGTDLDIKVSRTRAPATQVLTLCTAANEWVDERAITAYGESHIGISDATNLYP